MSTQRSYLRCHNKNIGHYILDSLNRTLAIFFNTLRLKKVGLNFAQKIRIIRIKTFCVIKKLLKIKRNLKKVIIQALSYLKSINDFSDTIYLLLNIYAQLLLFQISLLLLYLCNSSHYFNYSSP